MINFLNKANAADQRVYELLNEKFSLFSGVFGASDEVLGAIESGIEFENRIVEIYQTCREPEQIDFQFKELRSELDDQITEAMDTTRQKLLENFDAEVYDKLRVNLKESKDYLDKYSQRLWDLSLNCLKDYAEFEEHKHRFTLMHVPEYADSSILLGNYEIGKSVDDAHVFGIRHPLAQSVIESIKEKNLPMADLLFDYSSNIVTSAKVEPLVGQSGWLVMTLHTVETFGEAEDSIVFAMQTDEGLVVTREQMEALWSYSVKSVTTIDAEIPEVLNQQIAEEKKTVADAISIRNLGFFSEEIDKLDSWADDQKQGLEETIKELEKQIKEVRKQAKTAMSLQEKLDLQKQQRNMEGKRNKFRKELFDRQDEVDMRRDQLIENLEQKLEQKITEQPIFSVRWAVC